MITLKFRGIDGFNRPVFQGSDGKYYGSTDKLFSLMSDKREVLQNIKISDLCYFGSYFDCEPMGDPIDQANFAIINH